MLSDKLLSLLQTFSRPDLNRFRKFLQSPYFNDQDDVIRLFELIDTAFRNGDDTLKGLEKSGIWKALYPNQRLDDGHLRRLTSDLTLQAQQFLVEEARRQDPLATALDLQKVLEKPELQKHLSGVERQIQKILDQKEGKSTDFYFSQFRQHWHIFNRATKSVATTGYTDKLAQVDFFLECFYLVQKLKFYISWLLYRGFRVTEWEVPVISGFWDYLNDDRFAAVPLIRVYRKVIVSFTKSDDESHFEALLVELNLNAPDLTKADLRECYYMAQNYCALRINQGKNLYYYKVFEIFKTMVDKDILVEDNQLPEAVFKNIITASLGVREFAWTEQFIQQYANFLPARIRENARRFNLAYLYFHQKEYTKVIEHLRDVELNDVVYALGAKSILVRTYYEQGEYLALDSLIDSFKIYLRRNKVISKNLKREYNNYLNIIKKLASLTSSDRKVISDLRARVMQASYDMPKHWLLRKIEEIEGIEK